MAALVFATPDLKRHWDRSLGWHVTQIVKEILVINENRDEITWVKVKKDEKLGRHMEMLSTWFKEPLEVVQQTFRQ